MAPEHRRMTPDETRTTASILERALQLPEAEREAYLAGACGQGTPLLALLRAILSARAAAAQYSPSQHQAAGADLAARAEGMPDLTACRTAERGAAMPEAGFPEAAPPPGRGGVDRSDPPQRAAWESQDADPPSAEGPGEGDASGLDAAMLVEAPGARLGPYTLLRLLGEGGFGRVYLAQQERPVRRQVALKIIRLGMDTRSVIARFEAERQALALMTHPGIAQVFDAGATRAGRPYFVMELVDGAPITTFCDSRKLGIPARISLFRKVCAAVQHAHRKGVIHRDLKPSNILVAERDGDAIPKVIDFGIAKATHTRLTERTLVTARNMFIGTPEYMSPEQADLSRADADVDTRADVYALGVILYELLTGGTPLGDRRLNALDVPQMQRLIREEPAQRPSSRVSATAPRRAQVAAERSVSPERLPRLLRGDLDWIVLRALEKERDRRYESPSALSADLGRHLAGLPVEARPPSTSYRLRKFAQRHRGAVIAASAILLTLFIGMTGTATFAVQAALRAAHSHQVEQFLRRLFGASGPISEGSIADASPELLNEARHLFADDVGTANQVLLSFAARLRAAGSPLQAIGILTDALERQDGVKGSPEEAGARLLLASLQSDLGRHPAAIEQGKLAVQLLQRSGADDWRLGTAQRQIAGILTAAQQPEAAFDALRRAIESLEGAAKGPAVQTAAGAAASQREAAPESIAARADAALLLTGAIPESDRFPISMREQFLRESADVAAREDSAPSARLIIERALAGTLFRKAANQPSEELNAQLDRLLALSDDFLKDEPVSRIDVYSFAIRCHRDTNHLQRAVELADALIRIAEPLEPTDPHRIESLSSAAAIYRRSAGPQGHGDDKAMRRAVELQREHYEAVRTARGADHAETIAAAIALAHQLQRAPETKHAEEGMRILDELLAALHVAHGPAPHRDRLQPLDTKVYLLEELSREQPTNAELLARTDQAYRTLIAERRALVPPAERLQAIARYARWCTQVDRRTDALDQLLLAMEAAGAAGVNSVTFAECLTAILEMRELVSSSAEHRGPAIRAAEELARLQAADRSLTAPPPSELPEIIGGVLEWLAALGEPAKAVELGREVDATLAKRAAEPLIDAVRACLRARALILAGDAEGSRRELEQIELSGSGEGARYELASLLILTERVRLLRRCQIQPSTAAQDRLALLEALRRLAPRQREPRFQQALLRGWQVLNGPS
jgi:serine/threonine protein kinase